MNERKPRVLMISLEKGLFEAGAVRERIVKQCAEFERTTIIVFGKQKYDEMLAPNVRVVSTGSWNKFFYVADACRLALKLKKEEGRRKKGEDEKAFDVVVTQDPVETALVGVFAARMAVCALAVQDHGYHFHGDYYRKESLLNRFRFLFAKWVVKRAEAVRVVSKRTEEALVKLGVDQSKIVRFPLAVRQPGARSPERGMEGAEPGARSPESGMIGSGLRASGLESYFLLAARFVPIKRIDLAVHAFSLIVSRYPDVKLKIVGRGPLESEVKDKIKEFGLESQVEILPWTDKLDELYRNARATLITSDREGFGMTAVESLVNGTPVIMTDVGCAGEVVKDGENGYIVPVGDVEGLADRMIRVLEEGGTVKEGAGRFVWQATDVGIGDLVARAVDNFKSVASGQWLVDSQSEKNTEEQVWRSRLLFITQVVDRKDPILGFVIRWIQEFVNQNVKMTVFARRMVKEDLPEAVFGVDMGQPIVGRVLKMWWYSLKLRKRYDAVFVHMTPQLVVLGWPLWRLMGKRVYMWYMHRSVTWWLKVALWMTNKTFTASDLSLRVDSPKKTIVGHGIDTDQFKPIEGLRREPVVLWVSRIQPRKKLEESLSFMAAFKAAYPDVPWTMRIIGTAEGHEGYLLAMRREAERLAIADRVRFEGPMKHDDLPHVFASSAAFISTSQTGSIDKVVLEALACGTPVLAVGEEYRDLSGVSDLADWQRSFKTLKTRLMILGNSSEAREVVVLYHDLKRLVGVLVANMKI